MVLSADEIDLIDAWFVGGHTEAEQQQAAPPIAPATPTLDDSSKPLLGERTAQWWQETTGSRKDDLALATAGANDQQEEFPRIVRNRLKA